MDKELQTKMINYIEALEGVNAQLVLALKQCVELLSNVQNPALDSKGWQNILDDFRGIIKTGERVYEKKMFH